MATTIVVQRRWKHKRLWKAADCGENQDDSRRKPGVRQGNTEKIFHKYQNTLDTNWLREGNSRCASFLPSLGTFRRSLSSIRTPDKGQRGVPVSAHLEKATMNSLEMDREVIRCKTCGLVQYRTRTGNCR